MPSTRADHRYSSPPASPTMRRTIGRSVYDRPRPRHRRAALGDGAAKRLRMLQQHFAQTGRPREGDAARQRAFRVDRAARLADLAPAANRVEILERESQGIHRGMTACTDRIAYDASRAVRGPTPACRPLPGRAGQARSPAARAAAPRECSRAATCRAAPATSGWDAAVTISRLPWPRRPPRGWPAARSRGETDCRQRPECRRTGPGDR